MIIGRTASHPPRRRHGSSSYYEEHGGFLVAAAITQYVYVTIQRTPLDHIMLRYSSIERAKSVDEIKHGIIRESLKKVGLLTPNIEITSMADIPAGTGLGSSGSFTTRLLEVLYKYRRSLIHPSELAELACHIEIDILKEPVGKQDQYIAAYGGVTAFEFAKDGSVRARSVQASEDVLDLLEDNLVIVSTGFYRAASVVLKEQNDRSQQNDREMIDNLHY